MPYKLFQVLELLHITMLGHVATATECDAAAPVLHGIVLELTFNPVIHLWNLEWPHQRVSASGVGGGGILEEREPDKKRISLYWQ